MSETPETPTTEIFNTTVADQLKILAGGGSPKPDGASAAREKKPPEKRTPPARTPNRAALTVALLKNKIPPPSIGRSMERTKAIGQMLDEGREWVSSCALEIVSLWKEINESDEGSATRDLLEEEAGKIIPNLISKVVAFIGLEHADSSLSDDEKKRLARSFAIYYASVVLGAHYAPDAEIWRAVWLLLQTGAARVVHDEFPQGAESVRVLPKMWVEFPHALLGAPTTDGSALEKSGLLDVFGTVVNLITKDSEGYWECIGDAKKGASINSIAGFLKTPRAGIFTLTVFPYHSDSGQFYEGGTIAVKSEGSEDISFHLSIIQVVDNCVLTSYEHAVRVKAPLQVKFLSLSSGFNAVLRGERLPNLKLPFEGFKAKNLNDPRIDIGRFENDEDKFKALCHISRVLKRALRMAINLPAPRTSAKPRHGGTKQADVKKSGGEPRRETAEKRGPREEKRSKTAPEAISPEERSQAEKALKQVSDEKNLAVIPQAGIFSPAQPSGCAHAVLRSPVRGSSGIHCVVVRSVARAKAEIYWYPKRLGHLFSEGKYSGLVFSYFVKQTKFDHFKSRAPVLPKKPEEVNPAPAAPVAEATAEMAEEGQKQEDGPNPEVRHAVAEVNVWASPQARALAEKLGIADEVISAKRGSKVTKADVLAHHNKTAEG